MAGLVSASAGGEAERAASPATLEVLVIGAGQAGLATGYHLRSTGLTFALVDRNARVGDSWRQRWDSLRLFTPRSYSHLPGLRLEGDADGFATRDEVADYLESYARRFDLPVHSGVTVSRLEKHGDAFHASLDNGAMIRAHTVIVATGAFQVPAVPTVAIGFGPDVAQLTPLTYRNPASVPGGPVLVVGDGATGRQIAMELAASHAVLLARGKSRSLVPERLLGRSIFWWLDHLGILRASSESRIGRRIRARDGFPGRSLRDGRMVAGGVELLGRLVEADGRTATFAGAERREVAAVVWATGYRDDTSWLHIRETLQGNAVVTSRGSSPTTGLFFVGRPYEFTQASALLYGVGADADVVVARAAAVVRAGRPSPASPSTG